MKKHQVLYWLAFSLSIALSLPVSALETEKIYVAVEGEGKVAVFDSASRQLLRSIDLSNITNLVSDDLSIIDLATDQEIARLPVGDEPNGVSVWNKQIGGTP
jgi:YVTN family beta-propeller protein